MSDLILFDVRPRFDPVTVNLGSPATYELWLQITNISPFLVELDQASFRFQFGGVRLESLILEHMQFPTGETKAFHIEGPINEEQAAQMARYLDSHNDADLSGVMEFNCKLHSFSKNQWQLRGIKPRVVNATYRLQTLGLPTKA